MESGHRNILNRTYIPFMVLGIILSVHVSSAAPRHKHQARRIHLTESERIYIPRCTKVLSIVADAESKLKSADKYPSNISTAATELYNAREILFNTPKVPQRFITANSYLTKGITEDMATISCLQDDDFVIGKKHWMKAWELFQKAIKSFRVELKAVQEGR